MRLDVRGEICPYPMLKAVEALKKLQGEDEVEVLTDHAPSLTTIPWEAAKLGYETEIEEVGSPEWKLTLRKAKADVKPQELIVNLQKRLAELNVAE
jgi:tRNA 2-thiouridine synthesizing protein A